MLLLLLLYRTFDIPNKSRPREPNLEVQLGMERLGKAAKGTANRPDGWRLGKPCKDKHLSLGGTLNSAAPSTSCMQLGSLALDLHVVQGGKLRRLVLAVNI
jgi:hypothetical protein